MLPWNLRQLISYFFALIIYSINLLKTARKTFATGNAIDPLPRTIIQITNDNSIFRKEVKVDTVPSGNMNYVQDNMFLGQLPKRLVIGCVDSDALNWTNMKPARPWMLAHLKIIWQFHAHPVQQKVSRFFGPRYIGDDFFLGPNLVSFNRAVVPLLELSFLTKSQKLTSA